MFSSLSGLSKPWSHLDCMTDAKEGLTALPWELFEKAFPFYLMWDQASKVVSSGASMQRVPRRSTGLSSG